jgi:hypothetical protein
VQSSFAAHLGGGIVASVSNEIKIPISLPGAAQASQDAAEVAAGLDQVAGAAKKGGKAAEDQAKGAEQAGKQILSLGETTEKGIGIGRMFSEALNGNLYALLNVTAALKVTGAAIKTSLVGMILLGLTALAQFLPTLIEKLSGKKDSLADGFDAAREAGEKLNQAKLEALQEQLEGIKERASAARTEMDLVQAAADKLDDAQMAADLAVNKADPNLTDDEKARREMDIRNNAATSKRNRKLAGLARAEEIDKVETDRLASVAVAKAEEYAGAFTKVMAAKARRDGLSEEKKGLGIEFNNIGGFPSLKQGEEMTAEKRAQAKRASQIADRLTAISREENSLNDPNVIEQEARDRRNALARRGDFETAQKALKGGMSSYDALRRKNDIERGFMGAEANEIARKNDAERYGITGPVNPIYSPVAPGRPEMRIVDPRHGGSPDTRGATEEGAKTGKEVADNMLAFVRANNDAIIQAQKASKAQYDAELARIRSQMAASPSRQGN